MSELQRNRSNTNTNTDTTQSSSPSTEQSKSGSNSHSSAPLTPPKTICVALKTADKYKVIDAILTTLMLFFTFSYQLWDLLNFFGHPQKWFGFVTDCGVWPGFAAAMWHISKCCIYNIYILRMKVSFKGSAYEYSNKLLYSLIIFANIWVIYAIYGDITEIYGSYEYVQSEDIYWCQFYLALSGMMVTGGFDTILSMICLILFLKPLVSILKKKNDDDKLEDFIIKYFLLSLIAISSTGIWITCSTFSTEAGAFIGLDSSINALCVFLMFGKYQKYYFFLCDPCHNCIKKWKTKKNSPDVDQGINDIDL